MSVNSAVKEAGHEAAPHDGPSSLVEKPDGNGFRYGSSATLLALTTAAVSSQG